MLNWLTIDKYDPELQENVHIWSQEFIDPDFNPSGIIDGYYQEDLGCWFGWKWNGCQDCYETGTVMPTHFAVKENPILALQAFDPTGE